MTRTIEHYTGSLDFPCDFCDKNSYDNYHFKKNKQLELTKTTGHSGVKFININ